MPLGEPSKREEKTTMSGPETVSETDESSSTTTSNYGLGFDFFHPATTKREQRRYWFHFSVYVILMCFAVWPLLVPFNRIEPYVLSMPFNMFWSSFVIGLVAVNTYFLFRFDVGSLTATEDETER